MSQQDQAGPRELAIAGGVMASAALAFGVLLATLASPSNFNARLEALYRGVGDAQRLARPVRGATILPAGAVCASAADATTSLSTALREAAGQAQLQAIRVQVATEPRRGRTGLVPLRIRFEAEGGYDAALQMLDLIGRQQPQVFADTTDLVSKGATVSLAFSGRAFCES